MRKLLSLFVLGVAACGGHAEELPPHGEALVIVDTDLPVPHLASRMRVDLFDETGRWFESRDTGRTDPRDWPASFSIYSDDDQKPKRVMVRLRVYPEGITRDYTGERFETRPEYKAPFRAKNVDELCANAPELPIGGRVQLHAGSVPITDVVPSTTCDQPARAGSVAARVVIERAGRYRFDVADAYPYSSHVALALRKTCTDSTSQLACELEPLNSTSLFTPGHFPRFDAKLDPGTYFLVTATVLPNWPADLTLEAMPIDAPLPDPTPLTSDSPRDPELPRLQRLDDTRDVTPASEPLPTATIDRLLLVTLTPGVRGSVRVTMSGSCAGTMAKLGSDTSRPDLGSAMTCIDTENVRVPLGETPLDPDLTKPTTSVQGTFGRGETCAQGTRDDVTCIPGGPFLLGNRLVSSFSATAAASVPERIAAMSRFWMDKREVSVGRFRAAIARGFTFADGDVKVNNRSIPVTASLTSAIELFCTWSATPREREDYPINCIDWRVARSFCEFEGGSLPTDAQWEYAAGAAGRPFQTSYPWGEDVPTCDRSIIGRAPMSDGTCVDANASPPRLPGPVPLAASPPGDVTPLGLMGMGGNVQEWTRDSAAGYTSTCWRAATLHDPSCIDDDAPSASIRGGCWMSNGYESVANRNQCPVAMPARGLPGAAGPNPIAGFRCAYREEPR